MNNRIQVSRKRFFEIFADSKYQVINNERQWTSCPWYEVVDVTSNKEVGGYSDGSWENTFEVDFEFASKEDIVAHYEKIVSRQKSSLEYSNKQLNKLSKYKKLTLKETALIQEKEVKQADLRKNHPGMYDIFPEEKNMLHYNPLSQSSTDSFEKTLDFIVEYSREWLAKQKGLDKDIQEIVDKSIKSIY